MIENDDRRGLWENLIMEYNNVKTKADIEHQQLMDQIDLALEGKSAFPSREEVESANEWRYRERDVLTRMTDFLTEHGLTVETQTS